MATAPEPLKPFPDNLRLFSHLFVASMVLTWIASSVPYPYSFGSIVTSALAVVFATLALWFTVGVERSGLLRMFLAAGGLLALLSVLAGLGSLLIAQELVAQSECEARALTRIGVERCVDEFNQLLNDRFPDLDLP